MSTANIDGFRKITLIPTLYSKPRKDLITNKMIPILCKNHDNHHRLKLKYITRSRRYMRTVLEAPDLDRHFLMKTIHRKRAIYSNIPYNLLCHCGAPSKPSRRIVSVPQSMPNSRTPAEILQKSTTMSSPTSAAFATHSEKLSCNWNWIIDRLRA